MVSAYAQCTAVEEEAWPFLAVWLRSLSDDGTFERVPNRWGDYELQCDGDAWVTIAGERQGVELKAEREDKYGNFYLEAWSDRRKQRRGWLYTSRATWLVYTFLAPRPV